MEDKTFYVMTVHAVFTCRGIEELAKKVKALEILGFGYEIFYGNKFEIIKM